MNRHPQAPSRKRRGIPAELREVYEAAVDQGWRIERARGRANTILCYPPDGVSRPIPIHPSRRHDPNLAKRAKCQFRAAGLDI